MQIASTLHIPLWYHASTLEERLASSFQRGPDHLSSGRTSSEQARKKLQIWKEQAPFDKGSLFADRLALDKITEQDLLVLLDEPVEALQHRLAQVSPPDWLLELVHNLEADSFTARIAQAFKAAEKTPGAYALLQPFYPLLQRGTERFLEDIAALSRHYNYLPFNPDTLLTLCLPNLASQMLPKLGRVVVLEMNIARLRGELQGDTPQERFHHYLLRLSQREHLQAFLAEYSILARQLLGTIDLWVNCHLELAHRLCRDWEQIRAKFAPDQDPGLLTEVAGGAGDTHRNGHSVMILTFHSQWRLVYKPRSLRIDCHFQELLTWVNAHGTHPAFRTLNILDKKTHGWVEFVSDAECTSENEIRRFYERQGGYLALLYVLDAIDVHAENVIAAGEHPFLIDLEALFHPRVKAADAESPAQEVLARSVLKIALLPQRIWSNDEFAGVDMSGLGKTEGQLSPRPVAQWENMGTDEMKVVWERIKLGSNKNTPGLRGQHVQVLDFIQNILTGFTSMYRLLRAYRDEFAINMLPRFASAEIRFITRATRTYTLLLHESFHPNILRDALKRERFFDRLWIGAEHQPHLQRLIQAERADLFRGDIPLFTAYPDSRDLFTSQGERLPAFFPATALEQVSQRLFRLDEDDLSQQIWLIRAAFTSTPMTDFPVASYALSSHTSPAPVSRERLFKEAGAIGDRLCEMALQNDDCADWLGLAFVKEREWNVMPAGIDLYSGLPGIILFLSYLGAISGEELYTTCASAALKTLRVMIGRITSMEERLNIGAFNGIGSCIYLFAHLAVLWHDPSLLQEAEDLVQLLPKWITTDDQFDVMDGSAGCILSLLSLFAVSPSLVTLTTAIDCGDHLLSCVQSLQEKLKWPAPQQITPLPGGFAHGSTGIAYALLKLADASGEERFHQAALEALAHERDQFLAAGSRCLDCQKPLQMKQAEEQSVLPIMSWHQGVSGRVLALLASRDNREHNEITRQEIALALSMLLEADIGYHYELVGPNHSLAYGDTGLLEALLVAAQTFDTPHLHVARERRAAQLLASKNQHGWIMGVPLNVETPGLMMGLAGIGYELLRLGEPGRVPSILVLAPPLVHTSPDFHGSEIQTS